MSWTIAENNRITAIEREINRILERLIPNLASKLQVRKLLLIKQSEVDALKSRINALEEQVAVLQKRLG
jgi:polyhydroxyalkanoate synthesis regulator phasin